MEGTIKDVDSQDALKEIRQEYNAVRVRTDGSVLEHLTSLSLLRISAYHILHLSDYQNIFILRSVWESVILILRTFMEGWVIY